MGRLVNALEGLSKYAELGDLDSMQKAGIKPDFRIYTAGMETVFDVNQQPTNTVRMVGSSTVQDLQGDTMHLNALHSMTEMQPNLTVWLNHSYILPDDVFGSICEPPAIIHQGGIADLHLAVDTEMDNPRAAKVKRYIDNGRKLGCSVGCLVTSYEVPDPETDGPEYYRNPIIIHGVYVMEFSVVGIPANQRSWVENAIKGLFLRTYDPNLVPAMKSLWPVAFKEVLDDNPEAHGISRKLLEVITPRPPMQRKMEWRPMERKFFLVGAGREQEVAFDRASTTLHGTTKSSLPVQELADLSAIETIDDWTAEWLLEYEPEAVKAACGKTSWPLADKGRSWDGPGAKKRLNAWAGDNKNKLKQVYFWTDGQEHFKLPFCDVISGSIKAVPRAIQAVAGSLGGSRSGLNVPDADKSAIRSKVATYYRRMGETPPWQADDSKALEEFYMEENGEITTKVFALNADGSQGIEIDKATGDHGVMSGDHGHAHNAFSHASAGADGNHNHSHTHQGDNYHGHVHDNIDADGDGDHGQRDGDTARLGNTSVGNNATTASGTPEEHKHAQPVLEPSQTSILAAANGLLAQLGLTEVTPEMVVRGQMASLKDVAVNADHVSHLQQIHDHAMASAASMGHSVCGGDGNLSAANGVSMQDATDQARMANGQDAAAQAPQMRGVELTERLATAFERLNQASVTMFERKAAEAQLADYRREMEQARTEVQQFAEVLESMRTVRIPRPTQLARSVQPDEEGRAFHGDFLALAPATGGTLLDEIKALTTVAEVRNGNLRMRVRQWPAGSLKDRRPALDPQQLTYMTWQMVEAYRNGEAAEVPMIHDPLES